MKKVILAATIVLFIVGLGVTKSYTYEYGPPAGYTNISGYNCTSCHYATLNAGGGNLKISIGGQTRPYHYKLDSTYTVYVTITDSKMSVFGFEATPADYTSSYNFVGTLGKLTTNTSLVSSNQYVEHNKADTTRHFRFSWKAPHVDTGTVRIFACGVAGNKSGGFYTSSGNHVYASEDSIQFKASTDIYHITLTQPVLRFYSNNLHVVLPDHYNTSAIVNLYELNGRILETSSINGNIALNLAHLNAGMYVAAVVDENGAVNIIKFIKN